MTTIADLADLGISNDPRGVPLPAGATLADEWSTKTKDGVGRHFGGPIFDIGEKRVVGTCGFQDSRAGSGPVLITS